MGFREVNRNLAADTKVSVVSELLEVLDDLERGAQQGSQGSTGGSSLLQTLAAKFETRLKALGFQRIEAQSECERGLSLL